MTLCSKCGANIGPDENFCGTCGMRRQRDDALGSTFGVPTGDQQGAVSHYSQKLADGNSTIAPPEDESAVSRRGTGELAESSQFSGETSRTGETPERRSKPKALTGGKVLNNRYEIVRRIGGGGMGAVYLAKDRNLG